MRLFYVATIGLASIGVYSLLTGGYGGPVVPIVNAQSDMYLSRRIDQVEQRFNYIESRLSQIESDSRRSSIVPRPMPTSNEQDIQFLRAQVDGMRIRLGEAECGLLRVDERTLTAAQRASRRRTAQGSSEKCRENSGTPVDLSSRP